MVKRITAVCVVLFLLLPALSAPASAYSILWVSTSDHTDLVKDEEYAAEVDAAKLLISTASAMEDAASESAECVEGLEILYEEPAAPELDGVGEPAAPEPISVEEAAAPELDGVVDETVQQELIGVEDEAELPPEEVEEIELEENTNGEIQIP